MIKSMLFESEYLYHINFTAIVAPIATKTPVPVTAGASATVDNNLTGYDNTVLVNQNAIVTVTVRDDNKLPIANKTVVFALTDTGNGKYETKGNTTAVTDQDGKASFVVGNKNTVTDPTNASARGVAKYNATIVGTNYSITGKVGFSDIDLGKVETIYPKVQNEIMLNPGSNAKSTLKTPTKPSLTTSLSEKDVEYVSAQQVSAQATTSNAITYSVTPRIYVHDLTVESVKAKDFEQNVNRKSGTYGTYETEKYVDEGTTAIIELEEDTNNLQYATLNFNSIQISQYTTLKIAAYDNVDCRASHMVPGSEMIYEGPKEQTAFAYQIPMTAGVKAVKVWIESAGQVQSDKNAGFDIKNITGVYKEGATDGEYVTLAGASVNWNIVEPVRSNELGNKKEGEYDEQQEIKDAVIAIESDRESEIREHTFSYQVPVFPYTGNAIIKEFDKNNNIVNYYLAPTYRSTNSRSNDKYTNFNIFEYLNSTVENNGTRNSQNTNILDLSKGLYKATKEEALETIKDGMTQNGNNVTVNSTKVGSTTLEGIVSIEGLGQEQLDATNRKLYTSVHWNPIPNVEESDSKAFLAFTGQKITVYGQIVDKNGNPVSLSGRDVVYTSNGRIIAKGIEDGISVIDQKPTDVNGRSTLILTSSQIQALTNVEASINGNEGYGVKLSVGGSEVLLADLYWVDADLLYKSDSNKGDDELVAGANETFVTNKVVTNNNTTPAAISAPTVGTPWEYAVKTVATKDEDGILFGWTIEDVEGLKITMSGSGENKGTYDFTTGGNGVALAKSEYANVIDNDVITARISEDSIASNVTFVLTKDGKEEKYIGVGTGAPSVNAKLQLPIDWKRDGVNLTMLTPEGTSIATTGTAIYVKVVDNTGKNVLPNEKVTFQSGNRNDTLKSGNNTATGGQEIEVTTDINGIAKVTVEKSESGENKSVITAKVDTIDAVSTQINWVTDDKIGFGIVGAKVSGDNNTELELRFNKDVNPSSVKADEFTLTATVNDKQITYNVKAARAEESKVYLTLPNALSTNEYTIEVGSCKEAGIEYNLTDTLGKKISANTKAVFNSDAVAQFDVSAVKDTNTINIENLKAPITPVDTKDFVVTVNGEIMEDVTVTEVTENKAYTVTINKNLDINDTVRVYYMGYVEFARAQ